MAIAGQDEAVAVVREQPRHLAMHRCGVGLDVAAHLARRILELARDGGESVADRHIDVLVSVIFRSGPIHDDFPARHRKVDPHRNKSPW